jgi:hypothetical protein
VRRHLESGLREEANCFATGVHLDDVDNPMRLNSSESVVEQESAHTATMVISPDDAPGQHSSIASISETAARDDFPGFVLDDKVVSEVCVQELGELLTVALTEVSVGRRVKERETVISMTGVVGTDPHKGMFADGDKTAD